MFAPDPDRRPAAPLVPCARLMLTTGLCLRPRPHQGRRQARHQDRRQARCAPGRCHSFRLGPGAQPRPQPPLHPQRRDPSRLGRPRRWHQDSDDPPACFATDNSASSPRTRSSTSAASATSARSPSTTPPTATLARSSSASPRTPRPTTRPRLRLPQWQVPAPPSRLTARKARFVKLHLQGLVAQGPRRRQHPLPPRGRGLRQASREG